MNFEPPASVRAALEEMDERRAAAARDGIPWCDIHDRPMVEDPDGFGCPSCEALQAVQAAKSIDDDIPFAEKIYPDPLFKYGEDPETGEIAMKLPDPERNTLGKFHEGAAPTEVAAAVRTIPRTGTQRGLILAALAAAADRGLTDEEIAVVPGVADTAHRTRRNELVVDGWVRDSGRTRETESGSPSIIWIVAEQARPLLP